MLGKSLPTRFHFSQIVTNISDKRSVACQRQLLVKGLTVNEEKRKVFWGDPMEIAASESRGFGQGLPGQARPRRGSAKAFR